MHHVEHAAIQRHQRDQQQIRKRDPRQRNRQFAARRIVLEPRRENGDHLRHEPPAPATSRTICAASSSVKMRSANSLRRGFALAVQMRIGRNEGGVEGALGEDGAKMIGQPQRHEKRVRHGAGAENGGEHDVARKSGQPREQRITADGEDASEHAPLLAHIRAERRNQAAERAAHRLDDPILRRLVEIGVHRQADDIVRSCSLTGSPPSATGKSL